MITTNYTSMLFNICIQYIDTYIYIYTDMYICTYIYIYILCIYVSSDYDGEPQGTMLEIIQATRGLSSQQKSHEG